MLKAFMRSFFGKSPQVGDVMTFDDFSSDCPFDRPSAYKVEVLEVKNGWVRYRFKDSTFYQNEVMKLSNFRFCYKPQ